MKWAYGITTVPDRKFSYLPKTVESLKKAGFHTPTLFVDGPTLDYSGFKLPIVRRYNKIMAFGNWWLSLMELWIRNPKADRFAIFQDDFLTYPYLREYLESCELADDTFWNLLTFPENERLRPKDHVGWYMSNQRGRGAVALVFSAKRLYNLLLDPLLMAKPRDRSLAHRSIDGSLITAMAKAEVKELVHYPTLVYHIGDCSTIGNYQHKKSTSFQGEGFDARQLIKQGVPNG